MGSCCVAAAIGVPIAERPVGERSGIGVFSIEPLRPRVCFSLAAVLVLVSAACAATQESSCTGQTVRLIREDVLTVGTDFAYPPFAFDHPDTGDPSGFDVELGQAVAEQLGLKILLVNRTAAALVPGLLAHRHDLAASALIATPELESEVCLSEPYLQADLGLLTRSGDPPAVTGTDDLEGRTVAVVEGSRGHAWVRDNAGPEVSITPFPASEDLPAAVLAGEADASVDDLPVVEYAAVRSEDLAVVGEIETGDHYVLATAPDNRGLVELVDEALMGLRENGRLEALLGKWFGR